jgi:hypothetical protein
MNSVLPLLTIENADNSNDGLFIKYKLILFSCYMQLTKSGLSTHKSLEHGTFSNVGFYLILL